MLKNNKMNQSPVKVNFNFILLIVVIMLSACSSTGGNLQSESGESATLVQSPTQQAMAANQQSIPTADDDQDGVINASDECKDTLPHTWVDIKGCALDTDGDQVADSRDACRGTPRGVKVDERGCGFDDDHDGVPNYRDRCSKTIKDVSVDANGCEWDSDNDGVVDSKDLCAGTPPGVKVEDIGCHIIEVVTLQGVHFKTGSDDLSSEARKVLKRVASKLRVHPRMRVEIAGHTDNTGSEGVNAQLSLDRARAATRFLVDLGINKKVLTTHGYAEKQPVASNDTEQGRTRNRRVEIRFVEID